MTISGKQIIGNTFSASGDKTFLALNPKNGQTLETHFYNATFEEVDQAVRLAENAFTTFRLKTRVEKALFLERIGEEILNLGDDLIERCMSETALPPARLKGERSRTVNQLRMFGQLIRTGNWVDARIDTAVPDREPIPKPDVRQLLIPLGPVAIFGASNFPLAFSVAGGDTASAIAAGCTVVVKGHPAHPGTSEMIGQAIMKAASELGMPDGVFSMVQGTSNDVGAALVNHPLIQAVGFTGSLKGGKALFDLASTREIPIPVFAEMGSTNPSFILPGAMKSNEDLAKGLVNSITLGTGQFCTNPGLLFLMDSEDGDKLRKRTSDLFSQITAGTMLTAFIKKSYDQKIDSVVQIPGVEVLSKGFREDNVCGVSGQLFYMTVETFNKNPVLREEIFGPSSLLVGVQSKSELLETAKNLEGHLTASIHGTDEDFKEYEELFKILERKVGRLIINGFPTGVEVCHSMMHGGPYPATTSSQYTSVGTNAIRRFVRPVCYQNFPDNLLPEELRNENTAGIWRLVDGEWRNGDLHDRI